VDAFERLSGAAQRMLSLAQEEAERSHHTSIGTEHLLLGLCRQSDSVAGRILARVGVQLPVVREKLDEILEPSAATGLARSPTPRVKHVMELAFEEARTGGVTHVGTGEVLVGLLVDGEGIAAQVLHDLGIQLEPVRTEVRAMSDREGS
jgi:ATP-dependent Clp protease ATP-binding subunit ClpC